MSNSEIKEIKEIFSRFENKIIGYTWEWRAHIPMFLKFCTLSDLIYQNSGLKLLTKETMVQFQKDAYHHIPMLEFRSITRLIYMIGY
jgi:hypothetical protein